ncbi:MAG TPA: hypothetical protein PLT37_10930 [Kiritimatiellia bacterium]|jgi:hypothetical protein|nr:hypothetical protein [Kiritimatiellia bacterium]
MNHARRRIGWLLLSIILAVAIVGPILYRQYAVKRDIHTAFSIYSGIRPNYNMNVPVSYSFVPWEEDAYPATGRFSSSTEYFRNTMTNHLLQGCNYGIFALSGMPPCWEEDPAAFTSNHNAWCVVLDYDPHRLPDAPFMFSRNLDIQRLSEAHPDRLRNVVPYGRKGVLIVMADGTAKFIRPSDIIDVFIQPGLTNAVLRP